MQTHLENEWLRIFRLQGEIDVATAPPFREAVEQACQEGQKWFLVDLLQTEYIDSVALGILIGGAKIADQLGGMLTVVCTRSNLIKLFEVTGTKELLNVRDSEAAARELLQTAQQACDGAEDGGA